MAPSSSSIVCAGMDRYVNESRTNDVGFFCMCSCVLLCLWLREEMRGPCNRNSSSERVYLENSMSRQTRTAPQKATVNVCKQNNRTISLPEWSSSQTQGAKLIPALVQYHTCNIRIPNIRLEERTITSLSADVGEMSSPRPTEDDDSFLCVSHSAGNSSNGSSI